jgi:hypothetical protein
LGSAAVRNKTSPIKTQEPSIKYGPDQIGTEKGQERERDRSGRYRINGSGRRLRLNKFLVDCDPGAPKKIRCWAEEWYSIIIIVNVSVANSSGFSSSVVS